MKALLERLRPFASRWKLWLPGVLLVLAATTGVIVTVVDEDGDNQPDHIVIDLPRGAQVQADRDQQADRPELHEADQGTQQQPEPAAEVQTPDVHEDSRDETPPGVTPADGEQITDGFTAGLGEPRPAGGAQRLSCPQRFVRNRSSRAGARVKLFVLHYTVSRPGSLDVIRGLFNTPSFAASSTYGLEPTGRCEQWVPFSQKPWTQLTFNPVSESVEIMAMGTEPRSWWLAQPIIRDGLLAEMVRDRLRDNGLPLRRVNPSGCAVQRAGWTDHNALECGNTHHDVAPNFPYDVLARQVREGTQPTGRAALTTAERKAVDCVQAKRRIRKRHDGWERVSARHRWEYLNCRRLLQRANRRLHDVGLSTDRRRARHEYIHRVL